MHILGFAKTVLLSAALHPSMRQVAHQGLQLATQSSSRNSNEPRNRTLTSKLDEGHLKSCKAVIVFETLGVQTKRPCCTDPSINELKKKKRMDRKGTRQLIDLAEEYSLNDVAYSAKDLMDALFAMGIDGDFLLRDEHGSVDPIRVMLVHRAMCFFCVDWMVPPLARIYRRESVSWIDYIIIYLLGFPSKDE